MSKEEKTFTKYAISIKRVYIEHNRSCDTIYLYTNLPAPIQASTMGKAVLKLEVDKEYGREYVNENFPRIEIVEE
jgi:hypothetical protein